MRRLLWAAASAALLLILVPETALGHAAFVSGSPGPGDNVVGSPAELAITFSQDLDPSRTSLEIRDASGRTLAKGGELGDGPREFRLALPDLQAGKYSVRWTSFSSEDNELARDTYSFTVIAAPSPSPSPSASPTTPPSLSPSAPASPTLSPMPASPVPPPSAGAGGQTAASGDGLVVVPILAAALLVGGLMVWLLHRRPK